MFENRFGSTDAFKMTTFDLGTLSNPFVAFLHMMDLCWNRRDCFLSIRANSSSTTISAWMAHSRWTSIVVKEYVILVCPWSYLWNQCMMGGIPSHLGHKTLGKKVCYCQSLPSNVVILAIGASYSVYWWVQSLLYSRLHQIHLKSQMFHSNLPPLWLLQKGIRCDWAIL